MVLSACFHQFIADLLGGEFHAQRYEEDQSSLGSQFQIDSTIWVPEELEMSEIRSDLVHVRHQFKSLNSGPEYPADTNMSVRNWSWRRIGVGRTILSSTSIWSEKACSQVCLSQEVVTQEEYLRGSSVQIDFADPIQDIEILSMLAGVGP